MARARARGGWYLEQFDEFPNTIARGGKRKLEVHGYTPDVKEVINEARWVAETEIFHVNVKVECLPSW